MEILNVHKNSIQNRMNLNDEPETIILLEDYGIYNISFLKEISNSQNDNFSFLTEIIVQYEGLEEIEQKKCLIKDLKNNFFFIKIINKNNDEINEMNFLVLKSDYLTDDILLKINEKAVFANKIKKMLKIKDFPLDDYKLIEYNNLGCYGYYDKIYRIVEKNFNNPSYEEEINNDKNYINNINNINDSIKKLIEKKILFEEKIKDLEMLMNGAIIEYKKKFNFICFKIAEKLYLNNLNENINNNNINNDIKDENLQLNVFIHSNKKNTYLSMSKEGQILEKEEPSPWDIEINFFDKKISFCSNKLYLSENNGNALGQKDISKWGFQIINNSYYFINNNNLLSIEKPYIKTNKINPEDYELFQLIGIYEDNNNNNNNNISSCKPSDLLISNSLSD